MKDITGEYYLQGVREMASGFLIKPDKTFQFFITYGALDRYGSGTWSVNGDKLILNSAARPGNDFALVSSHKRPHPFINLVVDHKNPMLLRHVYGSLEGGAEGTWEQMSQRGDLQFPSRQIESISLMFEFCPERFSVIPVTETEHNEFVFRPEPWLLEVFLDNFMLHIAAGELSGRHPLLEGSDFRYAKS